METETGTVEKVFRDKQIGYISPDLGGRSIFLTRT